MRLSWESTHHAPKNAMICLSFPAKSLTPMQSEKTTASIFINYRRVPTKPDALNIQHELEKHFGEGSVFLDIKDIEPGDYWGQNLEQNLHNARILVVLIDANWLRAQDPETGIRRLDQEHDWVRKEIAFFLEAAKKGADKTIIPVLLNEGTVFPRKEHLPEVLRDLAASQHSCRIRTENISYDIMQLVDAIKKRGVSAADGPAQPSLGALDEVYPLPELTLTEARRTLTDPYVGLRYFEEKEAHIYFGRDADLFKLINSIGQPDYNLCLLYGPSGVGKSSLVHAGLLPRIRPKYSIYGPYRRSFVQGLDAQLLEALEKAHAGGNSKPALILLDQVEEMFTHTNPERPQEAPAFFSALTAALRENSRSIRFLLSFRFEHFTSVFKPLEGAGVQVLSLGLDPLQRPAVRQAIEGVLKRPPLPERFGLCIEEDLIETMIHAVSSDKDSHIAPLLQLQLRSMWDEAVALDDREPRFDRTLYKRFEKYGLQQMMEHLLGRLPETWKPALESGLIIGLLHRFVTPRGTAGSARTEDLIDAYPHIESFTGLLQALEDAYLLIALPNGEGYRLAHDALAPIVQQMHQSSDLPGQRAARIIETKARDHDRNYDLAFSEVDLEIVRAGQPGMPAINPGLLARIEQDEARYRAEREQRFRLAFDAAEKEVEHLNYDKALNDLQLAAGYGIRLDKVLQVAHTLPFVFALMGKEAQLRDSMALVQRLTEDGTALSWMQAATPQAFLQDLARLDTALWQAMQQRHFPTLLPIPGGTYPMGSEEGYEDEKPVHTVTVDDFLLADTPVTFWQYGLFCLLTGRRLPNDSGFGRGDRPVININWFDAAAYCNWLSEREGLEKVYADERDDDNLPADFTSNGYRLPTEAEWEYAAGGGAENRSRFGNGKEVADPAEINFDAEHPYNERYYPNLYVKGKSRRATTPVRQFSPNALGLHDMSGNVYEWCQDWWSEGEDHFYAKSEGARNPLGPEEGSTRVVRGGSWDVNAYYCRASYRVRVHPIETYYNIGFRVSRRLNNP